MLRISSKAGVRSDPSPHGSVRLIDKPPIVTSVVIWSVQTGAGACDFRCASRATSCLNCLEVNNVWSRCSACSLNRPEAGMREISSATPSARTYKTFWRPSMPPNSPTEKSPNGSDGTADGPMSEQPATANGGCRHEHRDSTAKLSGGDHNIMTNWP
jgi:hypothetical protein